jgi:hypothetical protein
MSGFPHEDFYIKGGQIIYRGPSGESFPLSDFDVDLNERRVIHRTSGIWVQFYEYLSKEDWLKSDSITYREVPTWTGDRNILIGAAKRAAIEKGMTERRPAQAEAR